jgi:hypothetical protein
MPTGAVWTIKLFDDLIIVVDPHGAIQFEKQDFIDLKSSLNDWV